jgi:L-threonine kinase
MNYSVKIYARIGELIQGILPDRSSFLVSGFASSTLYAEATLEDGPDSHALPPKARQALSLFLQAHSQRIGGSSAPSTTFTLAGTSPLTTTPPLAGKSIRLSSNIPPGKGLSSSSADVLSVLYVVNDYLTAGFTSEELYHIAARVEPTDPCLSQDIVLFKQQAGITEGSIPLPPLTLLYFDAAPELQIDTLDLQRPYSTDAPRFFDALLRTFLLSAARADYAGILNCITQSSIYNQAILALPGFDACLELAVDTGAGLMVAHSGTIIGLISPPEQAAAILPQLEALNRRHQLTSGQLQLTPIHKENYISCSNP